MNGTRITTERERLGLTQAELASKVNVSQKSISKYERNERRPSYETLTKMADLFNVDVDYLICRTNERKKMHDKNIFNDEHGSNTEREKKLIRVFRELNEDNQDILIGKAKELVKEQRLSFYYSEKETAE